MFAILIYVASLLIPYPTVQHFVWPLHWCLLADICNHTWIPECGTEDEEDRYNRRLFIDECDMYEYNCDFESDYYAINYSDCFNVPTTACPPIPPCPSIPTCPDHRFHRMGQKYKFTPTKSKLVKKPRSTTKVSLPIHMLRGRRRYSPTWKKKKRLTTKVTVKMSTTIKKEKKTKAKVKTAVLKKKEITKTERKLKKVFKGIKKREQSKKQDESDDFLE